MFFSFPQSVAGNDQVTCPFCREILQMEMDNIAEEAPVDRTLMGFMEIFGLVGEGDESESVEAHNIEETAEPKAETMAGPSGVPQASFLTLQPLEAASGFGARVRTVDSIYTEEPITIHDGDNSSSGTEELLLPYERNDAQIKSNSSTVPSAVPARTTSAGASTSGYSTSMKGTGASTSGYSTSTRPERLNSVPHEQRIQLKKLLKMVKKKERAKRKKRHSAKKNAKKTRSDGI